MEKKEITCDACGRDLQYSGNSVDWRISLRNQEIPHESGVVTDMMIYPKMPQNYDLCNITCLKAIVEKL